MSHDLPQWLLGGWYGADALAALARLYLPLIRWPAHEHETAPTRR